MTQPVHDDDAVPSAASDAAPTFHALGGTHVAGVATPARGSQQVEMWIGRIEAGASSPPHSHDTEQVVHFLSGTGWVNLSGQEIAYQEGVTVILPAGCVHQLVAETESGFVAAMPSGGTIRLPYGELMDLPWRR